MQESIIILTMISDPSARSGETMPMPEMGPTYDRFVGWLSRHGRDFVPADESFRPLALIEQFTDTILRPGAEASESAAAAERPARHAYDTSRKLSGIPVARYAGGKEYDVPGSVLAKVLPGVAEELGYPYKLRFNREEAGYGHERTGNGRYRHFQPALFLAVDRLPETGIFTEEIIIVPNSDIDVANPDKDPAFLVGRAIWGDNQGHDSLTYNVRRQRLEERFMLEEGTLPGVPEREARAFADIAQHLDTLRQFAEA